MKILLVEDDSSVVRFLDFVLGEAGCEVITVRSVGEGWKLLRNEAFDAAIVDIHLPGAFGWELIERVRRDPGLKGLPVVVSSGSLETADLEQARELGAVAMPKPLDGAEVVAKLHELTGSGDEWVERSPVEASVFTDTQRYDGTLHVSPAYERFSDQMDDLLGDERRSLPLTDVVIRTLEGVEVGSSHYVQLAKARITAILPPLER